MMITDKAIVVLLPEFVAITTKTKDKYLQSHVIDLIIILNYCSLYISWNITQCQLCPL